MKKPTPRVAIVGAGMAGLTATVYLARSGYQVTVFEKSGQVGGLVQSFEREGFVFDAGPRAIGNAGIVKPMLEDLSVDVPLVRSHVSTGIAGQMVHYESIRDLEGWVAVLRHLFPESLADVEAIAGHMRSNSRLMAALNRVANPYFKDLLRDPGYLWGVLIPWLPTFLSILVKTAVGKASVEKVLTRLSKNQSLTDMICQAFFKGTPQEFALGYCHNFTDYWYPLGGTGRLPQALHQAAEKAGAQFRLNTGVREVDAVCKTVVDNQGNTTAYDALLWAADLQTLYTVCPTKGLSQRYQGLPCAESVVSVFLAVDLPPEFFSHIAHGHCLYTPETRGLGDLHRAQLDTLKAQLPTQGPEPLWAWLAEFCRYNSYELSVPVLKDASLAPPGKTGLIASLLFDGELCLALEARGWHQEFKARVTAHVIENLTASLYPGLKDHLLFSDCATPASLHRRFGTTNGAIVGWSLEQPVPVAHHLSQILSAVKTPIAGVYQAGQWTYSPAGVPVAVLTGRIAASAITKKLGRVKTR